MTDATRPAVERMQPPQALWDRVVNPAMRALLRSRASGLVDSRLALLQFRGRRSGRDYELPIGVHRDGGRLRVLTNSGWRVNFRGGHPLRLRFEGAWREGTGTLVEGPDEVAAFYAARIEELGWRKARQLGIRINVDRAPTHDELRAAAERMGLSIVDLELG